MDDERTRAVRLIVSGVAGDELDEGEVELGESIDAKLLLIASSDSLDEILKDIVAGVLALAIAQGVTPQAVLSLLLENVPAAASWPTELLSPEHFDA